MALGSASSSSELQLAAPEALLLLEEATSLKAVVMASAFTDSSRHSSNAHLGDIIPSNFTIYL
jgi:hypothetical protein